MNHKEIKIADYIYSDKEEVELEFNDSELKALQKECRGISYDQNHKIIFDARQFASYCLGRIRAIRIDGVEKGNYMYLFNRRRHCYESVSETNMKSVFMSIMDEYDTKVYTSKKGKEILEYFNCLVKSFKVFPTTSLMVVFPNGTYSANKMKFKASFFKQVYNKTVRDYPYDEDAKCPRFEKFLKDIFNDDEELIALVQECFGYTFYYGESPMDVLFYFYGNGRNGKSVLGNILTKLHGQENISAMPLNKIGKDFNSAVLYDKAVNLSPENGNEVVLDTSMIKAITGRDIVVIEQKYQNPITTKLSTKLIVLANNYLRVADSSYGFWQRVVAVPFNNVYVPKRAGKKTEEGIKYQDPLLEKKLSEEMSGIFNWCMEGLKRLKDNNWTLTTSKASEELKDSFIALNDPVRVFVKSFVQRGNVQKPSDKVATSKVYSVFKEWCNKKQIVTNDLNTPMKFHSVFKKTLETMGISYEIRKNSTDYYIGIKLIECSSQ